MFTGIFLPYYYSNNFISGLSSSSDDDNEQDNSVLRSELTHLCERKIAVSHIIPKLMLSEAGKMSSTYFTNMLIEDVCTIGGFSNFCHDVECAAFRLLSNESN